MFSVLFNPLSRELAQRQKDNDIYSLLYYVLFSFSLCYIFVLDQTPYLHPKNLTGNSLVIMTYLILQSYPIQVKKRKKNSYVLASPQFGLVAACNCVTLFKY